MAVLIKLYSCKHLGGDVILVEFSGRSFAAAAIRPKFMHGR